MANWENGTGVLAYGRALIRQWVALMSGVIGVLLLFAAIVWPDQPDHPQYRLLVAGGSLVAFLIAGYSAWSKERSRVVELEARFSPKIQLGFQPKRPWVNRVEQSNVNGFEVPTIWYRLKVENTHPEMPAIDARVSITGIEYQNQSGAFEDTGFSVAQILSWSERFEPERFAPSTLFHSEPRFVDVISMDPIYERIKVKWPLQEWQANAALFERLGTYRLTVAASAKEGRSTIVRLLIDWSGDWQKDLNMRMEQA